VVIERGKTGAPVVTRLGEGYGYIANLLRINHRPGVAVRVDMAARLLFGEAIRAG
jgi:hypothetical protein